MSTLETLRHRNSVEIRKDEHALILLTDLGAWAVECWDLDMYSALSCPRNWFGMMVE